MKNKLLKLITSIYVILHLHIYIFAKDFQLKHLFIEDLVLEYK